MTPMRTASQHILFLATEYDAPGMHPYAVNIINSLWQAGDHVIIVTRHGAENEAFPDIPDNDITWIDYPAAKLQRAMFRYFPKRLNRAIDRVGNNMNQLAHRANIIGLVDKAEWDRAKALQRELREEVAKWR